MATRIVVASGTFTVAQTKQLANNIEKMNSSGAQAIYTLLGGLIPQPYGTFVAAGLIASAGAQQRSAIVKAASQGKRVRFVITDYKEYHTSYSLQYTYTIIK